MVKVVAGTICGSDIAIYNGTNSLATYPRIIGHEFGGEVVDVGSGVSGVSVGDIVAVDPVNSCGVCTMCTTGHHNICEVLEVAGVHRNGGFAEYFLTKEKNCYTLPDSVTDNKLSALVEPYSIGCQCNNRARIGADDFVVVLGSGPIGITVMQIAKSRGANVLMTDLLDARLERAKNMGADWVVNVTKDDLKEKVLEYGGRRPNVVVDGICSVDSPVQALDLAAPAGRVVLLGTRKDPSPIPQVFFMMKELDVFGSRLSNYCFPAVIELFKAGKVTPADMVTHDFPYEDVAEAIELIMNKPEEVCKVRLVF